MVRASIDRTATIAGGFVLVPVGELMAAWHMCRIRPLGIAHFRAWLACREMTARRRGGADRAPNYTPGELAALLGCAEKRARSAIRALEEAGLLTWSPSAISFPGAPGRGESPPLDAIGRGEGDLAIPRRMLRFLCKAGQPSLIAAALAVLCRCLSRRKSGFASRGRVKAGWIAETFGIGIRNAKAARARLIAVGWIEAEASGAWSERKWGRAYRIDLDWNPEAAEGGPISTPQGAPAGPIPTPPDLQTGNPSGTDRNQEPGGPGPAGARLEGRGSEGPPPGAPRLDDVKVEDLRDDERLLELHRQAVARKLVGPSEADRLRFAASAEHALATGTRNPAGLFAASVRGRWWHHATQADEDAARARLRRRDRGGARPADGGGSAIRPMGRIGHGDGLSEDARQVREVRAAVIRAGIFRDPWPAFGARNPGWTRARWDRALAELGLA